MADPSGLPMSLTRFSASVPTGSPEHIWIGPLKQMHGTEVHTRAEWIGLVNQIKGTPVSYDNLRQTIPGTAAHFRPAPGNGSRVRQAPGTRRRK